MSTDLSSKNFGYQTRGGIWAALTETVRPSLREAAKAVRMEAAWRTWPTIHRIAKALHNGLTTSADIEAEKQGWLHAYAKRCGDVYATAGQLGNINDPERREDIAMSLGLGKNFDDPNAEFTLDEVLDLYRSQYMQPSISGVSHDIA